MTVTVDPAATSREDMEYLRNLIELTILELPDAGNIVVQNIERSPLGAKVVAAGFGGKLDETARVSFAEFCVDNGRVDVLRAVLDASPQGVGLRTTCCSDYKVGNDVWSGWRQSLHQHAVKVSSPDALRLALEWDSEERCISEHSQVMGGTLHHNALVRVFKADDAVAAAECCRLLMDIGAPLKERNPDNAAVASGVFFDGGDWGDRADVVRGLLAQYMAAGLLELDVQPYGLKPAFEGMLPLRAAMAQGNTAGAVACIDLGCDLEKAVTTVNIRQTTGAKDLLELARSMTLDTGEQEAQMVASVTEAVMRRALVASEVRNAGVAPASAKRRRTIGV